MRIVVAPDSFKGSLSSIEVANAMEEGILSVFPDAQVIKVPIADGGEGTTESLVKATRGRFMNNKVIGPLGNLVEACWGILGDEQTAVIEMAAASGLTLIATGERNPLITTTYGTGQLIKAALDHGIRKLIIGIGGSATNDGGAGMARALGIKFLDSSGNELPNGGAALRDLEKINCTELDPRLAETTILVACDVDNPLCGVRGASAVYGPQKGATPAMVEELDQALKHYSLIAKVTTGKDVAEYPGAGAAGGLGAGLMIFASAQLKPGVEIVLEATNFEEKVKHADVVITGEGRTDFQTAHGKAPVGVASLAQNYNVPTICISGGLGTGYEDVLQKGIKGLMSIVSQPMTLEECMDSAGELVKAATSRLCQLIHVGMTIGSGISRTNDDA
ncbi:Glycerate kinase [Desulfosporosinus sp. I2]|uniref:glycerate kinase n=1 Tax=Desulfosporosinus sp. I2 TaxID=1617025 RepID=UPI0005EFE8A0|nr:glycerate kinase [Desulfosporosinus sp. I2]KJR45763.1 Glycerate kinase [Desulfosporosinus sp. I2]